jgi:hypothetical protein
MTPNNSMQGTHNSGAALAVPAPDAERSASVTQRNKWHFLAATRDKAWGYQLRT